MSQDLEEQVRLLTEQLRQVQADNERLRQVNIAPPMAAEQGQSAVQGQSTSQQQAANQQEPSSSGLRYVYVPRERKYPRFSGSTGPECLPVEEWVEEARKCLQIRHMSLSEQAYFVYDLLDAEAKMEIKLRPAAERADPEKIFSILLETFGCCHSYIEAQQRFFQCRQREGESLREFSHSLMTLMEIVQRKNPNAIPNSDVVLRDQFIEYVKDKMLRRELKQFLRLNPDTTFFAVRKEAFRWAEEGEGSRPVRARAYSCDAGSGAVGEWGVTTQAVAATPNNELIELKDCLRKQQAQLDNILKHLSSGPVPSASSNRGGFSSRRYRFTPGGQPICLRCEQPGHMVRDCQAGEGGRQQAQRVRGDPGQGPRNISAPPSGQQGN